MKICPHPLLVLLVFFVLTSNPADAEKPVRIDLDGYDASSGVIVKQHASRVHVTWPMDVDGRRGRLVFDLNADAPLIQSIGVGTFKEPVQLLAEGIDPVLFLRVGNRDLEKRNGWTIFFDRMQNKPNQVYRAEISRAQAVAKSHNGRVTLTIGNVTAGPFQGKLRWTFYVNCPFVLQEAVLSTERPRTAFLYDTGVVFRNSPPEKMIWKRSAGGVVYQNPSEFHGFETVAVKGRAIGAEFASGALALFPPPHRFFYPLDFSDNFENIWVGTDYHNEKLPFGFGIRHDPDGDDRYVPWFNAPPGTTQEMGLFLMLSDGSVDDVLEDVSRLTRHDHFDAIDGHTVFSSHYHVEHTRDILRVQENEAEPDDQTGQLPTGKQYRIPVEFREPGFVRTLRGHGVDIVHLAEFHYGNTPGRGLEERVHQLQLLHAECERLSDNNFLLLPGEEPNVHFGGHWISFFPKPVYWVLNRPEGAPFITEHPQLGRIYQVGGKADVHRMLQAEQGLAWTAHPRIKGSTGFPDKYRDELFYQSDRFLGAAWKAMPGDLSKPRLGSRVLDLLDDMSNWGTPKVIVGEVDVFEIEPDHELYGHMNVNYLRLDKNPRYEDGWQPVLDALRGGKFFVSTGEVLIPMFAINGKQSGELATVDESGQAELVLDLRWTFPLGYAEVISGDGRNVRRQRIDLSETGAFGKNSFRLDVDLSDARWVRIEIWDIATNGAFTQPVWLKPE